MPMPGSSPVPQYDHLPDIPSHGCRRIVRDANSPLAALLHSPLQAPDSPGRRDPPPNDSNNLVSSPWATGSLTLAPLLHNSSSSSSSDFQENLPQLPSRLFQPRGLSWLTNPNPFALLPSQPTDPEEPPPSTQQVRCTRPQSQHNNPESESSDIFGSDPFDSSFFDLQDTTLGLDGMAPPRQTPSRRTPAGRRCTHAATRSAVVDLTDSSPAVPTEPTSRKRKAKSPGEGRASKTATRPSEQEPSTGDEELSKVQVVDLADVETEADYEAVRAKAQKEQITSQNQADATKPVKLAEFQCIICMDAPTDLTVTHCGHLFCGECLHQALYAGDKKCCPVCRTGITIPKAGQKQGRNGIFVLEMKLMTARKKGKQAVRVM